jgi:hypothetical protein
VHAYGGAGALYRGSLLGAYLFSGVFALRYRVLSSDPFTAFRVYSRDAFDAAPLPGLAALESGSDITKLLLGAGIEIAEIPIYHRTFERFSSVKARLSRGLKNAVDSLT